MGINVYILCMFWFVIGVCVSICYIGVSLCIFDGLCVIFMLQMFVKEVIYVIGQVDIFGYVSGCVQVNNIVWVDCLFICFGNGVILIIIFFWFLFVVSGEG